MIAHIVLLQPRPDLTEDERRAALDTLASAATKIPEIRRFRLGRRVTHGLPGYEQMMTANYEFALIVEVDDVPALTRYLTAPAHRALGDLFATAYLLSQENLIDVTDLDEAVRELPLGVYKTYQRRVTQIENATGLRFFFTRNGDPAEHPAEEAVSRPA